ncbi:hypothetical protein HDK90DRAFT_487004, partial [Phyllosticta capitalensis]
MCSGLKYGCPQPSPKHHRYLGPPPAMCKTYHWTCHACGRSQSRGQRCSARIATSGASNNVTNCPTNINIDSPPSQADHNGIRCAYCHTPTMSQSKTEGHTVNPTSLVNNSKWEAHHPMMHPPSWNINASPPRPGLQHQAAPTGFQSPSNGPNASNYIAVSTMPPNAASQHHHYPSHVGHGQPNYPHQRHGGNPAPGSLPLYSQPHHNGRFAAPSSSGVPIDPQILPSPNHHQHPAPRSHPHGAASAPPYIPPTSASSRTQQNASPPQAHLPRQQSPHRPTPAATGATRGPTSGGQPNLRSPAEKLASMNATRTALFMQAEAQRDEGVAFGDSELQAAWYAMWEGCGVPSATVSAAAAAARDNSKEKGEKEGKDGESGGSQGN